MVTIWKFDLTLENGMKDVRMLWVPKGSKFLSVGIDPHPNSNDDLRVWAIVDTSAPKEPRLIRIAGTGHPLSGDEVYIGSVVAPPFAWHVFEIPS